MGDESLKTFGIVMRALKSLTEIQGPSPQQILSYINAEYNIPKEKIKRQLGLILKRCKEFGILKKTYGHQKVSPKKILTFTGKRPCCDCKDCTGKCGFCKSDDKKGVEKGKQSICRSSKSAASKKKKKKRDPSKKKKKKRDSCKKKKKKKIGRKKAKRRGPKKC